MEQKLEDCPFCGGEAVLTKSSILKLGYHIHCRNRLGCGANLEGEVYDDADEINYLTQEQIVSRWNTRKSTPQKELVGLVGKAIGDFLVKCYYEDGVAFRDSVYGNALLIGNLIANHFYAPAKRITSDQIMMAVQQAFDKYDQGEQLGRDVIKHLISKEVRKLMEGGE